MKTWLVDVEEIQMYQTIPIEAKTKEEAKEKAIELIQEGMVHCFNSELKVISVE